MENDKKIQSQLMHSTVPLPQPLSIKQILEDSPVSIRGLAEMDFPGVKASIIHAITTMTKQLAEFKRPSVEQITTCSDIIISEYSVLCMDDVRLCLLNGLKGLYGEIIGFDTSTICGWLTKYKEEKRVIAMSMPSKQFPKKQDAVPMPDYVKQLKDQLAPNKRIEFKPEIDPEEEHEFLYGKKVKKYPKCKPLTPSEVEIMGFEYFDKISKIQKDSQGFIEWGGEKYTQDTWQPFFVFHLYQNDEAFKELTDYVNQ